MKLLLIEDEMKLNKALLALLRKQGYVADGAGDGETGLEMAVGGNYDLIVLDRMLPKRDGISLLKELRQQGVGTPVIVITAKDSPHERVEGLDSGADDYLIKPFATVELLARIRALARRRAQVMVDVETLAASGVSFNPLKCEVTVGGQNIKLSVKESLLLELLLRNQGRVLTKERIFERVWGYASETEFGSVDLYIHYLRKKLKVPFIKTVRGVGYFWEGSH